MKTPVSSILAATALLLAFPPSLPSAETEFSPSLQFTTGLAGEQNKLTWPAQPGRYRISSSSGLSPSGSEGWKERAIVEPEGSVGYWVDPEPRGPRAFYKVEPLEAAIFSMDPAVLSPGAVLVITGQCLPAGSSVVFEIEGIPNVTAPIVVGADGRMTVTLPAFDLIIAPGSGMAPHVKRAGVVGPGGAPVCVIRQTFEATQSGFATYPPPGPPPASPSFLAIKEKGLPGPKKDKGHHRMAGRGDDDDDGDGPEPPFGVAVPKFIEVTGKPRGAQAKTSEARNTIGSMAWAAQAKTSEKKNTIGGIARRGALPGEVRIQECDIELAMPAGPRLAFVRTYSSMNQPSSICGTGWDHSYNVYITPIYDSTTLTEPTRVAIHTGDGHVNVMHRQADGVYRCDGLFREGRLNPDTSFTLTFADQSQFIFCPLVGAPWQGRIGSIVDRNGVALTCTYSAAGQLSTVSSQFGQSLALSYDTDGRVSMVTESVTGRFVSFNYFPAGMPGGNQGDLQSVTCPIIPGQAPVRGPETYTYSTGSADPRLNSNLLTVRDGALRLQSGFIYAATPPGSASYDRCEACDRFRTDPADPVMHFSYEFIPGSGGGAGGLLCIANSENGSVTEMECDRMHRPLSVRRYTTFSTPGMPATSTTNRPTAPPPGEPAFLEWTFAWNPDHLCTRCTEPDGLQTRVTYDRELRRGCPRIECGNARVVTIVSPDASQPPRTVSMDYLPGFGTGEGLAGAANCKSREVCGNGIWAGEDGDGGCTDDSAMRPGSPIGGLSIKGGRNPGGNVQGRSAGPDDDCDGQDDSDWTSNPIPGIGVVIKRNPGGSSVAELRGKLENMDDWETPVACTRLTTTTGQVFTWGYDTRGNCTSSTTPIAGSGTVRSYNALGQCTSVRVLNGPGSSFPGLRQYDPATHYLIGDTVDPDVNGTGEGLQITTTCERDALGRRIRTVDARGYDTLFTYNACDQLVTVASPPLGTTPANAGRVVCTQLYDAGGLPVRCDLDHRDAAGALVTSNPYYTGFCVYDSRGLLVMEATEQQPVDVPPGALDPSGLNMAYFNPKEYKFDHAGQCVRVSTPAASRGQTADEVCDFTWNARGLLSSITTGGTGTPGAVTTEYDYNVAGQVRSARTLALPPLTLSPTVIYTFDAWRRPATFTDEVGTVTSWSYANDGFVTVEVHGKAGDVGGTGPDVLLARRRARDCDFGDVVVRKDPDSASTSLLQAGGRGRRQKIFVTSIPAGLSIGLGVSAVKGTFTEPAASSSAFFHVFTSDDVCIAERFAPGDPAPHATVTTIVHHSPAGLRKWMSRNGHTLVLHDHDTAGRTIVTSIPGTVTRTCTLDACGNVAASTLTAHSTIPGASSETFTTASVFDPRNLCTSSTDSAGNLKTIARDSLERIISVTSPGGLTTSYAYDTVSSTGTFSSVVVTLPDVDGDGVLDYQASSVCLGGVCSSVTDAEGYTTHFICDSQNRITRTDFSDGTFETTTFNELGHPVSHVRRNGAIVACNFDYKARSTRVDVSNLPPGVVPVPPAERVWNGLGDCVQVTEGTSIVVRVRDSFGNLLSESQNGHTVTHTYNDRGCTGTTYPGGGRFSEVRNAQGQLLSFSAVNSAGVTLSPPITQRAYLGFACVADTSRNGVSTARDFRSDGEAELPFGGMVPDFTFGGCVRTTVTDANGTVLENHIIRRNADQCETQHHRAFAEIPAPPFRRMTFTLDARNLVTGCVTHVRRFAGTPAFVESDVHYVLDARGQRLSETRDGAPGLYPSSSAAPLFDHQMAQYSSWTGGDLEWDPHGCLTRLHRTGSSMEIIYDAFSRAAEIRDANGLTVAAYGYDADDRRISSTVFSNDPLVPPVTTFFLYNGPVCYQEFKMDGGLLVPGMTFGVSGGIRHCISTMNGSTYYPNGGGSSDTAIVFPIFDAIITRMEEVDNPDPVLERRCGPIPSYAPPGSHRVDHCQDTSCAMLTTATGMPSERFASTDSSQPIFLNGEGVPTGATSSAIDYRYCVCLRVDDGCAWCPESGLILCPGGFYSPELGQNVSTVSCKFKEANRLSFKKGE